MPQGLLGFGLGFVCANNRDVPPMNAPDTGFHLSVEHMAARYGVSKDTIWRWRREGDFPNTNLQKPNPCAA